MEGIPLCRRANEHNTYFPKLMKMARVFVIIIQSTRYLLKLMNSLCVCFCCSNPNSLRFSQSFTSFHQLPSILELAYWFRFAMFTIIHHQRLTLLMLAFNGNGRKLLSSFTPNPNVLHLIMRKKSEENDWCPRFYKFLLNF